MARRPGLPAEGGTATRARGGASTAARPAAAPAPRWHRWVLWLAMLATLPLINARVRGDGNAYFAYVRSIVIDHDLRIDHEQVASGASLLWSPFFLLAHASVPLLQARGIHVAADGFSWPYLWACAAGGACLVFLGLWWAYRLALRVASPNAALFALITIWLGSSLPVYLYVLPFYAHALASFAVSWFLWNWLQVSDGSLTRGRWFVWGLSAGLMTAVYYVNGVLIVIAVVEMLRQSVKGGRLPQVAVGTAWFGAGAVLALLPDVVIKRILQGHFPDLGYSPQLFTWADPKLWAVAFSSEHGAALWTPVVAVAAVGMLWAIWRSPVTGVPLMIGAVAFVYVIASYAGWHGGSSFGNRFLVSLTPVLVIGFGALAGSVLSRAGRRGWIAAWAVSGLIIVWNIGLMFQWGTHIIPDRGAVDMQVAARNQVTVVPSALVHFARRYAVDRERAIADIKR